MKQFIKEHFNFTQSLLAFLVGPVLMVIMFMLRLGQTGVYWQAGIILLAVGFVFYILWEQKQYRELKMRLVRVAIIITLVTAIVYIYHRQYVTPAKEQIISKHIVKP